MVREWDRDEKYERNGVERIRYLTLDQALALLLSEFIFEKHLTLDQVYFILLKNVLFIILILSC